MKYRLSVLIAILASGCSQPVNSPSSTARADRDLPADGATPAPKPDRNVTLNDLDAERILAYLGDAAGISDDDLVEAGLSKEDAEAITTRLAEGPIVSLLDLEVLDINRSALRAFADALEQRDPSHPDLYGFVTSTLAPDEDEGESGLCAFFLETEAGSRFGIIHLEEPCLAFHLEEHPESMQTGKRIRGAGLATPDAATRAQYEAVDANATYLVIAGENDLETTDQPTLLCEPAETDDDDVDSSSSVIQLLWSQAGRAGHLVQAAITDPDYKELVLGTGSGSIQPFTEVLILDSRVTASIATRAIAGSIRVTNGSEARIDLHDLRDGNHYFEEVLSCTPYEP